MKFKLLTATVLSAAFMVGCTETGNMDVGGMVSGFGRGGGGFGGGYGGGYGNGYNNGGSLQQGMHLLNAGGHLINANALSAKDEDSIGQSVGVSLTNQYGLVQDARLQKYVQLVGLTVASASGNPGGNWVFGVLNTQEVNAFSGPNGYVFVTLGAIQNMHDEAELAGVLGHEITHVCNHDGLKQVKAAENQAAFQQVMAAAPSQAAQFAAFADAGVDAITKKGYTQPQEFEADKGGVIVMQAAGYDPSSYLRFLQRLEAVSSQHGGQVMSTHPGIDQRIQRVGAQLQGMPKGGQMLRERFAASVPWQVR